MCKTPFKLISYRSSLGLYSLLLSVCLKNRRMLYSNKISFSTERNILSWEVIQAKWVSFFFFIKGLLQNASFFLYVIVQMLVVFMPKLLKVYSTMTKQILWFEYYIFINFFKICMQVRSNLKKQ